VYTLPCFHPQEFNKPLLEEGKGIESHTIHNGYALKAFRLLEKYYNNAGFDLIVDLDMNSNDFHFMMNSKHNISNMHKTQQMLK